MSNNQKFVMSQQEFKTRWDSGEDGGGINFEDIAECAISWGICSSPRIHRIEMIRYLVLKAAGIDNAEEYNPKNED